MIELHGWVTIRESYETDNEEENIQIIIADIKKYINNLNWESNLLSLSYFNGIPNLAVSLYTNHYTKQTDEVFELYKFIAKVANGSYGLIYLHNDEDDNGKDGVFQVFVLARGILSKAEDKFLSPLIPVVEDAEKSTN